MTMNIYLIRHGQTTGDIENRYGGSYDDHLTDEGEIQAHKLAEKLSDSGIQIILCSPLIRAQETAKIIKTKLNCEIKTIENLKERDQNSILSGLTRDEAKLKYPQLVEEVKDYRNQIQGAESYPDFVERIKKALMEISNSAGYSTIGVVTHGGPIRAIFREILKDREIDIADCAFAVLQSEDKTLKVKSLSGIEYKTD
jgi:broad specificity phosphatase PhoE